MAEANVGALQSEHHRLSEAATGIEPVYRALQALSSVPKTAVQRIFVAAVSSQRVHAGCEIVVTDGNHRYRCKHEAMTSTDDSNDSSLSQVAFHTTKEVAIEGAAGIAGFVIGGPLGALVGNSAGIAALKVVDTASQRLAERKRQREGLVVEQAAYESGRSETDVIEQLLQREGGEELLTTVFDACKAVGDRQRLALLARALASGALAADDTPIDQERLLADIVRNLSIPSIQILTKFEQTAFELGLDENSNNRTRGTLDETQLRKVVAHFEDTLDALMAELEGQGVVVSMTASTGFNDLTWGTSHIERSWRISPIGSRLLALLNNFPHRSEESAVDGGSD